MKGIYTYFNPVVQSKGYFKPINLLCCLLLGASLILDGCLKDIPSYRQLEGKYDTWRFAADGESTKFNSIPDFSYAGYERNKDSIPLVPVKAIVSPDTGDNTNMIQQAINKVSGMPLVNGFRGTVLLKAGTYHVGGTLNITTSGVVLRGEGTGLNGTILLATSATQYNLIQVSGSGSGFMETGKALSPVDSSGVAIGSNKIPVNNAADFSVGDSIVVVKSSNQEWLNYIGMSQFGWQTNQYQIVHRRIIQAINGDTLIVGIPMVDAIQSQFGGGYVATASFPGRISNCGVENIRLQCVYTSDSVETHAWIAIQMNRVTNSWVRNITAYYFGLSCVSLTGYSDFNTVQDCAMIDPKSERTYASMYSFAIGGGSMGNLFQRCYARDGRYDFIVLDQDTGPNVFLDCYSTNDEGDIGPHNGWATGILFDNVYAGVLESRNDGALGGGHGWTGAQTMFWNCKASQGVDVQSPPAGISWVVGCQSPWRNSSNAYFSSWGSPVQPRSIFLDQLSKRLGSNAVMGITVPSQRGNQNIWGELTQWGGENTALKVFP